MAIKFFIKTIALVLFTIQAAGQQKEKVFQGNDTFEFRNNYKFQFQEPTCYIAFTIYPDTGDSSISIGGDTTKALWMIHTELIRLQKQIKKLQQKPAFTIPNAAGQRVYAKQERYN